MHKAIIVLISVLELVAFPYFTSAYELIYPYGYNFMNTGYELSRAPPEELSLASASRLLPLPNIFSFLTATKYNPKCPTTATGGIISGIHCYTVTTVPTAFAAAQAACQANGGTLAEPAPNIVLSVAFYAALKAKFPTQFATIESASANPGKIWIGYQQNLAGVANPFLALDWTGRKAEAANLIFNPAVAVSTALLAAAIVNPGSTWNALVPTTLLPYICQFHLV